MNHNLRQLHPYPFAKMATLLADSQPNASYPAIKLGIGEPKHPPPAFVLQVLADNLGKVQHYPTTNGLPELRDAIADWLCRRFGLSGVNADSQVIPVMGTREAIFSLVQAVINPYADAADHSLHNSELSRCAASDCAPSHDTRPYVVMPNPFYQIYEGAALLANAQPYYVPCTPEHDYCADYTNVPETVWQRTQLVFVCSPNNPTGAVVSKQQWQHLIELSDRYGFVLASDECYSELYFDTPPVGLLQACADMGRHDYRHCVVFHSLSKRSNLPGLRSGFVAGDAKILQPYLSYRTYQGCAMPLHHQYASIAAWQDETHVEDNREQYRQKFALWMDRLGDTLDLRLPDAGFYFWLKVPERFGGDDEAFVKVLYEQANIHALAGRYLSREVNAHNPGVGYVRIALVASIEESTDAIARIEQVLG